MYLIRLIIQSIRTTKSGVTVDVRTEGKGPAAKNGQKLSMRYIGKLQNGHVFDKNVKGSPVCRHFRV